MNGYMLVITLLSLVVFYLLSTNRSVVFGLRNNLRRAHEDIVKLESELGRLKKLHPKCEKCHGTGLKIVGRKITDCGVIWQQDGTQCKECKGKGSL